MGAVSKDIAKINAQLATLAAEMQKVGATAAGRSGIQSMADSFRKDVAGIKGFETATMSARTATAQLTDEINRQKIQMKDLARVRKNLGQLAQEQLRLQDSSAMPMKRDLASGRVMGELIVGTQEYARNARVASMEAGILGRALESAGIQAVAEGKRMQWTGRQLTAGLTAPIVAVAGLSAKAAYDIDDAMVRLTKVYGDLGGTSEEELNKVRDATMDTARTIAQEYGIAGKATVELASDLAAAGYQGEELQATTREIQRISLLGQLDQQKAMDATRTIQTVFGHSTEELAHKFNFLNAVENQTNTTLQDLTEVIPRTASVIKDLGGTLEDSAVFTVAFKEAGIDAVQGANALRSSLGAIVAPSGVASKKLQALGIDMAAIVEQHRPENGGSLMSLLQALGEEMNSLGSVERQQAMSILFGRYQFNKMGGLLKGLSENANDAGTQVGRAMALAGASTEELAAVADREIKAIQESLSGRLRRAAQTIVVTFAEIGKPILSLVVMLVEGFAAVLNVINKFPGVIKGAIGAFALILAMAGPFMFFKGIFGVLYGSTMRWAGSMLAAKNKVGELQTTQSTFQAHAANTVIPTIAAEETAIHELGVAMSVAAEKTRLLALEQQGLSAGMAGGTTAGKGKHTNQYPKGTMLNGKNVGGDFMPKPHGPELPAGGVAALIPVNSTLGPLKEIDVETDKVEKKTARLRGHWTGIATSALLIAPMIMSMTGATGGWATALMGGMLILGLYPPLLTKIGTMIAGMGISKALVGTIAKGRAALVGFAAGAKGATLATRLLSVAVKALMGPIGWIIAGISAVMWGWNKYKKEMQEARDETHAVHTAGISLAKFLGYEYKTAQGVAGEETEKNVKTLHDQAKAWIDGSKEAKAYAEAIKALPNIERAANMARQAGLDALAAGVKPEEAFRIAKMAMAAGGYSEADILDALSISDFQDQKAAIEGQFEQAGEAFGKALTGSFKNAAKAEQAVKEFGPKIASALESMTKPEAFEALGRLDADLTGRANEILSDVNLDSTSLDLLDQYNVDPKNLDQVLKFFKDTLPAAQAAGKVTSGQAAALFVLSDAADVAAEKEKILVDALKEQYKLTASHYDDIDTLAELRKKVTGISMTAGDAERSYNDALAEGAALGQTASDAEKLTLRNMYERAAGMPETTSLTQDFGEASVVAAAGVDKLGEAMEAIDPASFKSAMRSAIQSDMSDAVGILMQSYDEDTEAYKDSVKSQHDAWQDAHDDRKQQSDDAFEARQRREEKEFDTQEKAMDKRHDKMLDDAEKQKDARVKAIEDEMDRADALDDKRKAMFEAEKTRIERLAQAANRNIDFNVALKTGDLDEAARIQEAAYTDEVSNAMDDAGAGMDTTAAARRAAGEAKIAKVTAAEQKRIDGIQAVIDKEKEAFEATKQRSKDALDLAKRDAADRFESEKRSYEATAKAAERAYDRTRAAQRKQVEESLKLIALEVPQNVEQYQKMFGTLDAEYTKQTGKAAAKTTEWNNLHRDGFHRAMEITFKELANEAAWKGVGATSVDSMVQGMLGMTFAEFANWMETGILPKKTASLPPNVGGGTNPQKLAGEGSSGGRHSGGPVDGSRGSRAGRPWDAPLYPDEQKIIAQKGEYVVQKDAVDKIGVPTLNAINSGQTSFFHEGGLVGAAGAQIMSTFKQAASLAIQKGAARKAEEMSAAGMYDDIPEALKYVAVAAKGGKFGGTNLTDEQLRNAATIIGVGKSMGASSRDLLIAIMTALQESTLRNVDHGDRDSVGLFQQRTSQGWGSIEQIMDPRYSSRKFFEALLKIKGRDQMGLAQAAQAVQRSAFPDAYAKWQDEAEAIVAATQGGGGPQFKGGGTFSAFGGKVTGDIQGLQVEFLNRLARWAAAVGQPYHVGSGFRSMAEQQVLYNRWMAGVPGQAQAAPPGRSNHNFGLASDGPHWRGKNPEKFGLTYPMSFEPWHVEPIGAKNMRVPQLAVGGHVNYDNTIANLHKNETVLTSSLSSKLENGINQLDSGSQNHYTIRIDGTGLDADAIAAKVITKIERKEQVRGPRRVIRD